MADATDAASSRIRIKMGQIEVEYEGSHAFLKEDLLALLSAVVDLKQKAGGADLESEHGGVDELKKKDKAAATVTGTVGALAAKLNVSSGPDLIIAAAAKLTFVDGAETFSRPQLLTSIKTASNYYKKTYNNNLSAYLKTLQADQRLTEPSTNNFALTAAEKKKLEGLLAG